jgi:hypothetical protein
MEMSPDQAELLSKDPRVKYVEEDFIVSAEDSQPNPPWGLDRIDQRGFPLDSTYNYSTTGAGVNAYVIDSGIRGTHDGFGGRVTFGVDFVGDGQNGADCNGHGTHVAGIIGNSTYGVAKNVSLYNVRVLGCDGTGTGSGILSAIDWVTSHAVAPAVVNISIGSSAPSATIETAISNSISTGINYALSAGNESVDACNHSPGGRVPTALTVGATDQFDFMASFSNFGPCVDIFAPGVSIVSSWNTSDRDGAYLSGTSMSSPHVAGVIARYLESYPTASPNEVKTSLINSATYQRVIDAGAGSPANILYANVVRNAQPPIAIYENSVANPYPSEITVSGLPPSISTAPGSVKVNINGFSVSEPDGVSMVLVGPTGIAMLIQGGVGYGTSPNFINYTISDDGPKEMPLYYTPLVDGAVYQPTDGSGANFPAPGPGGNYKSPGANCGQVDSEPCWRFSMAYGGTNPNGVWRLYVYDSDTRAKLGGSMQSWSLSINAVTPTGAPTPTPLPGPHIAVEDPLNNAVIDGASTIDFGGLPLGKSLDEAITVRNVGDDFLNISTITQDLDVADFGIYTGNTLKWVRPGGTTTFHLFFDPVRGSSGPVTGGIHVQTNSSDHNPFSFNVTGTVITPTPTPTPIPTPTPGPSSITFDASSYNVDEAGGHVDVTINRTGDTSGTATVDYSTLDEAPGTGHASQTSDYEIALGTVTFAPGESSKTFSVLIVDDKLVEGNETVGLSLSNLSGSNVSLGSPSTAEITIADNDNVSTSTNPYDDAKFFVRQHYLDFLNREPDQGGWDFWTNTISSCGADAACNEVNRINVSAAYFLSKEFQSTGYLAYLTHRSAFGPNAGSSPAPVLYNTFMHDMQELGKGYVDLQPGADAVLEANKVAYFNEFVNRPEFVAKYPLILSNQQFVDNLSNSASLVSNPSYVVGMNGGTMTRAKVLRAIAENSFLQSRELRAGFVTMEYFGYLRRDPDTSGFNFWLTKLTSFNGNYIQAEMVKAFIESSEDRQRFGAP